MGKMQGCTDGKMTIICIHFHCKCNYRTKDCEEFRMINKTRIVRGLVTDDCVCKHLSAQAVPSHYR